MIHSRGKMMLLECTKFRAFNNFLKLFWLFMHLAFRTLKIFPEYGASSK
jgi:hypothetical protein